MKRKLGSALVTTLALAGLAGSPAMATEPVDGNKAEAAAADVKTSNRKRAEREQAEAAKDAADAVLSATKLDLDIRLIGPTSVAGEL
jgi:hypothetical protein